MNLPNRLTLLRVLMVPLIMVLLLCTFPFHTLAAAAVFGLACLTDYFDGKIARERGLVTDFGKFLDPIADKMLTTGVFVVFLRMGIIDVWAVMLVLTREFAVSSMRMLAAKEGEVVPASIAGKVKTVAQYVALLFTMALLQWRELAERFPVMHITFTPPLWTARVMIWISVILTVISGAEYCWKLRWVVLPKGGDRRV